MSSLLTQNNLKNTKGREKIIAIIKRADMPVSAEEIFRQCLKGEKNVNLSTVYRTLNTLVEKNCLIKQVRPDGVAYFQENKHDHKHLLICTGCGKKIPLDICPLEKMLHDIALDSRFIITNHNIELYGLCPDCQLKKSN